MTLLSPSIQNLVDGDGSLHGNDKVCKKMKRPPFYRNFCSNLGRLARNATFFLKDLKINSKVHFNTDDIAQAKYC